MSGIRRWTVSLFILALAFSGAALAGEADSNASAPAPSSDLWQQLSKISTLSTQNAGRGPEIAVSGQTVVASGALGNDGSVAYVFIKPPEGWTNMKLVAHLRASALGQTGAYSVAIDGDTVAVGATQCSGRNCTRGAILVFVKPPGGWTDMTETARLTGSDALPRDSFGFSVSVSGGTIVAGADGGNSEIGAAYVFVKPAGGWKNMTQTAKLTPSDGTKYDFFGFSAAIDGNTIVIGSPQSYPSSGSGKVYVFVEPATGWQDMTQTAELTASDSFQNDQFGHSLGIKGGTVAVGAPGQGLAQFPGEAYVFTSSGTWSNMTQTGKLTALGATGYASLGYTIGVGDDFIAVGAPFDGNYFVGGSVFIFKKPKSGWANVSSKQKLFGADDRYLGGVGYILGISGNIVASATAAPSIYVFQLLPNEP